jgi:hypothetical protein
MRAEWGATLTYVAFIVFAGLTTFTIGLNEDGFNCGIPKAAPTLGASSPDVLVLCWHPGRRTRFNGPWLWYRLVAFGHQTKATGKVNMSSIWVGHPAIARWLIRHPKVAYLLIRVRELFRRGQDE